MNTIAQSASALVVLGTGGTIAGVGDDSLAQGYRAAQRSVQALLGPALADAADLAGLRIESRQVAQIDSKDMDWATWQALGRALRDELARPEVSGVVITHGTDTLEETACLLDRIVPPGKPLVLTAAMRPATSAQADGPANLRDALRVAHTAAGSGRSGAVVVMAGRIWPAQAVRKAHSHRIDAFEGDGGTPLGLVHPGGRIDLPHPWPAPGNRGWGWLERERPPRVEIVNSHAGADGWVVDALLSAEQAAPPDPLVGLVVACTGDGTVHQDLQRALQEAERRGVTIRRATRVPYGGVRAHNQDRWAAAGALTPAQARVVLMLDLMGA